MAEEAFTEITEIVDHDYRADALFWLGRTQFELKKFEDAATPLILFVEENKTDKRVTETAYLIASSASKFPSNDLACTTYSQLANLLTQPDPDVIEYVKIKLKPRNCNSRTLLAWLDPSHSQISKTVDQSSFIIAAETLRRDFNAQPIFDVLNEELNGTTPDGNKLSFQKLAITNVSLPQNKGFKLHYNCKGNAEAKLLKATEHKGFELLDTVTNSSVASIIEHPNLFKISLPGGQVGLSGLLDEKHASARLEVVVDRPTETVEMRVGNKKNSWSFDEFLRGMNANKDMHYQASIRLMLEKMTTKDTITVENQLTNVGHEKAISLLKARLTAVLGQNTGLEDWTVKVTAAQTENKIISIGRLFPESGGHVVYEQYESEITTAKMAGGTVAHFRIIKSIRHITTGVAFEEIL